MSLVSPDISNIGFGFGDAEVKINNVCIGLLSGECSWNFGITLAHDNTGLMPIKCVINSYYDTVEPVVTINWKEPLDFSVLEKMYSGLLDYTAGTKDVVVKPAGLTAGTRVLPIVLEINGLHVPISTLVESETLDDTPDGVLKTFSGTVTNVGVAVLFSNFSMTVTVSASPVTVTCDAQGNLSGSGITGTLDRLTGAWEITCETAPDDASDIVADYYYYADYQLQVLASKAVCDNLGEYIQNPTAGLEPSLAFKIQFDEDNSDYPLGKLVLTAVT